MNKQVQKVLSALVVLVLIFTASANAQIDSVLAAQLQQILTNRVLISGDHGVSACVIMPHGDTWKGTAGVGQGNIAITDTTVYHGASITKANIATLILLLAEDGLLNLDSSWHKYVTTLNVNFDTTITVRQLIGHTSGIADYLEAAGSGSYVTNDFNHAFTPEEILENIVSGVPDFAPGTDFGYSSSNFVLAALIAQRVTGNPVQNELRSRIWNPLGMTHTYFGGFETYTDPHAGVWWDFGSGTQNYSDSAETSMLTYGFGGANIVSTPGDLALFVRALMTGNMLSPASMSQMQVFSPESYSTWCAGYGLGIHHAYNFASDSMLGHDGYYTNMSDMFHSFDYGFTLVTMTNTPTQWFAIFNEMYFAIKSHITYGITDAAGSPSFNIFPNPATNAFTINNMLSNETALLQIINPAGEIVYIKTLSGQHEYDVEFRLAKGIYFVRVNDVVRKLVVE